MASVKEDMENNLPPWSGGRFMEVYLGKGRRREIGRPRWAAAWVAGIYSQALGSSL